MYYLIRIRDGKTIAQSEDRRELYTCAKMELKKGNSTYLKYEKENKGFAREEVK